MADETPRNVAHDETCSGSGVAGEVEGFLSKTKNVVREMNRLFHRISESDVGEWTTDK